MAVTRPRCTALCAGLLGSAAATQADEVFQDTWLRAIQARARLAAAGAAFRTWLFTLAHHRAVDCLRKTGREVSSTPEDKDDGEPWLPEGTPWVGWPAAPEPPQADDKAFWRAAGQKLLDCLDGLPLAQKSAFLLHHEDGLSVVKWRRPWRWAFETAKTRLRYAMGRLRACMGAYLPTAGST